MVLKLTNDPIPGYQVQTRMWDHIFIWKVYGRIRRFRLVDDAANVFIYTCELYEPDFNCKCSSAIFKRGLTTVCNEVISNCFRCFQVWLLLLQNIVVCPFMFILGDFSFLPRPIYGHELVLSDDETNLFVNFHNAVEFKREHIRDPNKDTIWILVRNYHFKW